MKESAVWFRHDANASKDKKIIALKKKLGREAVAVYWEIIEFLCEQPGYSFPDDLLCDGIAAADAVVMRAYCECKDIGLLQVNSRNEVFSQRLYDDQQEYRLICVRNKENARKRWEKQKVVTGAAVMPPQCDRNANTIQYNTIQSIDIPQGGPTSCSTDENTVPAKKRAKPKHPWTEPLSDEYLELCAKFGKSLVDREIPKCKDHFAQNEIMMRDWAATRRNWLRKSLEFIGKENNFKPRQNFQEQQRPRPPVVKSLESKPVVAKEIIDKFKRDIREKGFVKD